MRILIQVWKFYSRPLLSVAETRPHSQSAPPPPPTHVPIYSRTSWQIARRVQRPVSHHQRAPRKPPRPVDNIINIIKYNLHFSCWSNCLSTDDPSTSEYFPEAFHLFALDAASRHAARAATLLSRIDTNHPSFHWKEVVPSFGSERPNGFVWIMFEALRFSFLSLR